jgi:hypothetical protein
MAVGRPMMVAGVIVVMLPVHAVRVATAEARR